MKCNRCQHYEIHKMITSGKPYGYAGDIPCLRCIHFHKNDEFIDIKSPNKAFNLTKAEGRVK